MALDPDKLLSYSIPECRQRVTKQAAALYALSVGVGHDPLDERQLDLVDELTDEITRP